MGAPADTSAIVLSSGQMQLKIRYRELARAIFCSFVLSLPTFVLIQVAAHANGGWATLAVAAVGVVVAVVGFGARSFRANRPHVVALKFAASLAVTAGFLTALASRNPAAALIVGAMAALVGGVAARLVAHNGLYEFERETLQAIRRGDLRVTRRYFGEEEAYRIRIVDPPLHPPAEPFDPTVSS